MLKTFYIAFQASYVENVIQNNHRKIVCDVSKITDNDFQKALLVISRDIY